MLRRTQRPLPPPPPARWEGLIGEYGWDHNTLYVLEQDGQLQALIEWFFRYPLIEEGPDRFRFPDRGLYDHETLVFERDADGRATRAVLAGSVVFERRALSGEDGSTFRIEPTRTAEELRPEALAASPPVEEGRFRPTELVELVTLDPSIRLDVRYATTNNFMGARFYDEPRAFLQRPAAEALVRAHRALARDGYGLLVHDGYRPWYVTKMFWDATPPEQRLFVADPASGSRHNRGAAVDLTLYDLRTGEPIRMVSGYDEFSDRAFPDYPGGSDRERWLRERLREAMEDEGFHVYEWEWWHFDHGEWREYALGNQTFDRIGR
ncbi:MAG: M15 family metallopeptidase [Gemmatimonadetes bacterium]|nr:M15 family metallopeptidase [Gemmatimonadota bacterium]